MSQFDVISIAPAVAKAKSPLHLFFGHGAEAVSSALATLLPSALFPSAGLPSALPSAPWMDSGAPAHDSERLHVSMQAEAGAEAGVLVPAGAHEAHDESGLWRSQVRSQG